MKKLLVFLLVAGLLYEWLSPKSRTITLPPDGATPPLAIHGDGSREIVQVIIPGADMDYYTVGGGTVAEIRDALNRHHPVNGFDAHTLWHVSWHWPGIGTENCDLGAATLDTRISVTLPTWTPPAHADPALVLQWNRYAVSLAGHEQGHVQRARQGFADMQKILHDSTCTNADAELNAVLGAMRAADQEYDADTRHGVTQGAKFP